MQYGDWQLRSDAVYYAAQNAIMYPMSNIADEGSIHIESNVRGITRRITPKSYKLHSGDFHLSRVSETTVRISAGSANIQGYHLTVNTPLTISLPISNQVTPYTLGLSISYDAANNATGDVVNAADNSEVFSGVYLKFFDECSLIQNYDNILVIGRVWAKDGKIFENEYIPQTHTEYAGRFIANGVENDGENDHKIPANTVEVAVNGAKRTQFDGLPAIIAPADSATYTYKNANGEKIYLYANLSDVSMYDTTKYPVELNPQYSTKAPTFTTDIQDVINYLPDWYTSKYGDYMIGALRFNLLSADAKRVLDPDHAAEYAKDSATRTDSSNAGIYHDTDGIFISPRTLGHLHVNPQIAWEPTDIEAQYANGGTLMTIIPRSYSDGIDGESADGDAGGYAAMISQTEGDIGLRIRGLDGNKSRIVTDNHQNSPSSKQSSLQIENIGSASDNDVSSIRLYNGEVFIDSENGSGIQLFATSPEIENTNAHNVDVRVEPYTLSINEHSYLYKRNENDKRTSSEEFLGQTASYRGAEAGYGAYVDYANHQIIKSTASQYLQPYMQLGAAIAVHTDPTKADPYGYVVVDPQVSKQKRAVSGTDYVYVARSDIGGLIDVSKGVPRVQTLGGQYAKNIIAEDYIQVGTHIDDDVWGYDAAKNAMNRITLGKVNYTTSAQDDVQDGANQGFTFFEQTAYVDSSSAGREFIAAKISPYFSKADNSVSLRNKYECIGGIFSSDNIGASSAKLSPYTGVFENGPYTSDKEWVRFTRWRYDADNDKQYIGELKEDFGHSGSHDVVGQTKVYGDTYNIEFNTNVKNRRANQIIWQYNGGASEKDQPLVLSYIHDADSTVYPTPEYYDRNLMKHNNPTYGVRDFLRIDGGGLSIHGDLNNPTLMGDGNNTVNHLGITLVNGRVYSGTYNDYAETYEKADETEEAVTGMVVALDPDSGKYTICKEAQSSLVVGVISDNYGMLLGGKTLDNWEDQYRSVNQLDAFNIGVSGKLVVNVDREVRPGDLLVSSAIAGLATKMNQFIPGTIIGKALSRTEKVEGTNYYRCLMQIMLS